MLPLRTGYITNKISILYIVFSDVTQIKMTYYSGPAGTKLQKVADGRELPGNLNATSPQVNSPLFSNKSQTKIKQISDKVFNPNSTNMNFLQFPTNFKEIQTNFIQISKQKSNK